jgi:hypothetical protein
MTASEQGEVNRKSRKMELILSVVAVLYATLAVAFEFPKVQRTLMPIFNTWNFFGLQQRWSLFAPGVPIMTVHLIGIVTLDDGSKLIIEPPHPRNQPFFSRNIYNRYLKWEADCVLAQSYRPYLPKLCKHILEEFEFPGKKPKYCSLILEWTPISNPEKKISPRDEMPQRWYHTSLYKYEYPEGSQ